MTALAIGDDLRSRGVHATPRDVALYMTEWAVRSASDRVLDPAVGEGVFLDTTVQVLRQFGAREPLKGIAGIEVHRHSLGHAAQALATLRVAPVLRRADFFSMEPSDLGQPFDVVVGNPPYVRNGWFSAAVRARALKRTAAVGVPLPLSADLWALFVLHAVNFIKPSGRLAFVLPSALLQAAYAGPVRSFLLDHFSSVTVVTANRAIFQTAEVDVVLLLADQDGPPGLNLAHWSGFGSLDGASVRSVGNPSRIWALHKHPLGTELLRDLLADGRFVELKTAATVRIGTVTGANDFFVLRKSEVARRRLPPKLFRRVLVNPTLIRGAIVKQKDLNALDSADLPIHLMCLGRDGRDAKHARVAAYVRRGRRLGVHLGYKTAERHRWYEVVADAPPDLFLAYMSHDFVRVAVNVARAGSTNLVHQVRLHGSIGATALAGALSSSVAQLSAEVRGRTYGGGVLKLEPSDVQHLVIPAIDRSLDIELCRVLPSVDLLLRDGRPDDARRLVDDVLVRFGRFSRQEMADVHSELARIRAHRKTRGATHRALSRRAKIERGESPRR